MTLDFTSLHSQSLRPFIHVLNVSSFTSHVPSFQFCTPFRLDLDSEFTDSQVHIVCIRLLRLTAIAVISHSILALTLQHLLAAELVVTVHTDNLQFAGDYIGNWRYIESQVGADSHRYTILMRSPVLYALTQFHVRRNVFPSLVLVRVQFVHCVCDTVSVRVCVCVCVCVCVQRLY